jgi:NADH-quinone oxidoreductase subunit N
MATIVKSVCFFAFLKLFSAKSIDLGPSWKLLVGLVIFCTLLVGNITAVFQQSVKRMLSYSSISQAGFMLFALFANNALANEGIIIYSVAYSLATIGVFSILMKMEDISIQGYNGLAKSNPVLAFANTVFLLSLAGFPLTAGFFAKYYMLTSAVQSGCPLFLLIASILFAAIGIYYYFRVIQAMYFKDGEANTKMEITVSFKYGLLALSVVIIFLGIFPTTIIERFYF